MESDWYSMPHQVDDEEAPDHISDGRGSYRRRPEEYIRPPFALVLGDVETGIESYVRGVHFNQAQIESLEGRRECLAELIPEPGHWYDCEAVCIEIGSNKIGHLSASHAHVWHEILRRLNGRGDRIFVNAILQRFSYGGSSASRPDVEIGVRIFLPTFEQRGDQLTELGIRGEFYDLFDTLPTELKSSILESSHTSPNDRREIRKLSANMPTLPWKKTGSYALGEAHVPRLLETLLDDLRYQHAKKLRAAHPTFGMTRLEKEAWTAQEAQRVNGEVETEYEAVLQQVNQLIAAKLSSVEISHRIGCDIKHMDELLADAAKIV